jgi:hypothetical protein
MIRLSGQSLRHGHGLREAAVFVPGWTSLFLPLPGPIHSKLNYLADNVHIVQIRPLAALFPRLSSHGLRRPTIIAPSYVTLRTPGSHHYISRLVSDPHGPRSVFNTELSLWLCAAVSSLSHPQLTPGSVVRHRAVPLRTPSSHHYISRLVSDPHGLLSVFNTELSLGVRYTLLLDRSPCGPTSPYHSLASFRLITLHASSQPLHAAWSPLWVTARECSPRGGALSLSHTQ